MMLHGAKGRKEETTKGCEKRNQYYDVIGKDEIR
jgi:hypothetical protein